LTTTLCLRIRLSKDGTVGINEGGEWAPQGLWDEL